MVKDFRFGPLWDMNALKDLQTPYIWCEEAQSRISIGNGSHKTGLYTFRLYCMDRIQKDQSNYNEILSDTKFILDTIMTEIDQHPLFMELGLSIDSGDIVFEPVYEETDVNANGHSVEFTLRFPIRYTPCNVPIDPLAGYTYSLDNNVFNYSVQGVPGPQGITGPQGTEGPTGVQGPTGPQGFQGPQGVIATVVETIVQWRYSGLIPIGNQSGYFSSELSSFAFNGRFDFNIYDINNIDYTNWFGQLNTLVQNNNPSYLQIYDAVTISNTGLFQVLSVTGSGLTYSVLVSTQSIIANGSFNTTELYNVTWFANGSVGVQGPTGSQGNQGPQGFQGRIGPTGVQGPTGSQGNQGPQGFQGRIGPTGSQGPRGFQGFQGRQGPTGAQGRTGPTGSQGATGPQGTGPQGLQGNQGSTGPTGNQGATGPQGLQGFQGSTGPQGLQGFQGSTGPQGLQGDQGNQGPTGNQGTTGPQGFQGFQGATGIQGSTGPQGVAGGSANVFTYKAKTTITSGDPGSTFVIWNNATQASATQLNISHLTDGNPNVDIDFILALLKPNDTIILQDESNSNNYQKWIVSSNITIVSNLYVEIPVTLVSSTHTFANSNKLAVFIITSGNQGATGSQGNQGFQGPTGSQGPAGAQGNQGPQGFQGFQGPTGNQGNQGPQGFQGRTGPTGAQGNQGFQGPTGSQGNQGPQGFQGRTGSTGPQGATGVGTQGATGPQGPQGIGTQGPQGATGPAGGGVCEPADRIVLGSGAGLCSRLKGCWSGSYNLVMSEGANMNNGYCSSQNTIIGGLNNDVYYQYTQRSSIIGGFRNYIGFCGADNSIIGGQSNNICQNIGDSSIIGGYCNRISYNVYKSSIIGGECGCFFRNVYRGSIIGGFCNIINCNSDSSIIGGQLNFICCGSLNSSIIGVDCNKIKYSTSYGSIVGGLRNEINANNYNGILGGNCNLICGSSPGSAMSGGGANKICDSQYAIIIGGVENTIDASSARSAIIGGSNNILNSNSSNSVIIGGCNLQFGGLINRVVVPSLIIQPDPTTPQIRFAATSSVSSPNDGEMWFDGTSLLIQINGVTCTII